jgi:hypothetical protein
LIYNKQVNKREKESEYYHGFLMAPGHLMRVPSKTFWYGWSRMEEVESEIRSGIVREGGFIFIM